MMHIDDAAARGFTFPPNQKRSSHHRLHVRDRFTPRHGAQRATSGTPWATRTFSASPSLNVWGKGPAKAWRLRTREEGRCRFWFYCKNSPRNKLMPCSKFEVEPGKMTRLIGGGGRRVTVYQSAHAVGGIQLKCTILQFICAKVD